MRRFAAAAAVALAGCSTSMFDSSVDYKTASQLPPLEIPPDLTAPQRDGRFVLPDQKSATLSGYQQERKEQGRPGAAGVLPQVENVRLERLGAERWLVVQEPPDKVWPVVREFWLERGFLIKQETPEIGVLKTDWAENRANLPQDGIRGLLGRFADSVYSTSFTSSSSAISRFDAGARYPPSRYVTTSLRRIVASFSGTSLSVAPRRLPAR